MGVPVLRVRRRVPLAVSCCVCLRLLCNSVYVFNTPHASSMFTTRSDCYQITRLSARHVWQQCLATSRSKKSSHMAALLLLALKATAYHGEDNNWLVRVDGMIDANKCLRVGSITDLGADEANSNTGDRTTPNSNVTCGFGSAGLAPMCSLSKEAGSGVAEAVAEAQAAITQPASISGCVFDEASAPAC